MADGSSSKNRIGPHFIPWDLNKCYTDVEKILLEKIKNRIKFTCNTFYGGEFGLDYEQSSSNDTTKAQKKRIKKIIDILLKDDEFIIPLINIIEEAEARRKSEVRRKPRRRSSRPTSKSRTRSSRTRSSRTRRSRIRRSRTRSSRPTSKSRKRRTRRRSSRTISPS